MSRSSSRGVLRSTSIQGFGDRLKRSHVTPIVVPPASFAPFAEASIVPPYPPLQTRNPDEARVCPNSYACAYAGSPGCGRELPKRVMVQVKVTKTALL